MSVDPVLRSSYAEIPAAQAENDGWPQAAMPAMLDTLGLTEPPELAWFVCALNPAIATAAPDAWRYCHAVDDPAGPDLLGIAYGGDRPRVYLRADMSLTRTLQTFAHELYHLREFARGEPPDENAADEFGAQATARFFASQYR